MSETYVIAPDGTAYYGDAVGCVLDSNRGHYIAADTIIEYSSFANESELDDALHYRNGCDAYDCPRCDWLFDIADEVIERFNDAAMAQGAAASLGYWEGNLMLWSTDEWEEASW